MIFDTWVHPLMMGLEEHLLTMFRDDFEFNEQSAPSHLASEGGGSKNDNAAVEAGSDSLQKAGLTWELSAEKELRKIPFFVRGKARRNTEQFASEKGMTIINVDTLYEAKAHFAA